MEKLQVQIILEVLGRPVENVLDALNLLVSRLGTEQGVTVLEKKIHDPVPVPEAKDLYTSFAEINLELDTIERYLALLFAYMPSHAELVYPEEISIKNAQLNQIANQLLQRLHNYDAVTKNVLVERDMLSKKLKEIAPHLFQKKDQMEEKSEQNSSEENEKPKSKKKKSKKS